MLSQMRRHSQSWILKLFLAVIVLSFVFFWGSQDPGEGKTDARTYAFVNGTPITAQQVEAKLANSQQLQQWEQQFGGKLPPFLVDNMRRRVVENLVSSRLTVDWLSKQGYVVSKMELTDAVKKIPDAQVGGEFDFKRYMKINEQYAQAFGVSLEQSLKQDLVIEKLTEPFRTVFKPATSESKSRLALKNELRKFAIIKVRKEAPAEDKKPEDVAPENTDKTDKKQDKPETIKEGFGKELAEKILSQWRKKQDIKKILDSNKLKVDETEDLDIFALRQALDGKDDAASIKILLSLSKEKPMIEVPLEAGNYFYLFKLLDKTDAKGSEKEASLQSAESDLMEGPFALLNKVFIEGLRRKSSITYDLPVTKQQP